MFEETLLWDLYSCISLKRTVGEHCTHWWGFSESSSIRDLQEFFEEEKSRKLMKVHQIVQVLTIGYIEVFEQELRSAGKLISAVKNLLYNVHQNFLIFVDFILSSLNEEQRNLVRTTP